MEITRQLIFRRRIMAPCRPDGVVKSVWQPRDNSIEESLYAVGDDEDKGAECRCPHGSCCVDGRNNVIDGVAFNLPEND